MEVNEQLDKSAKTGLYTVPEKKKGRFARAARWIIPVLVILICAAIGINRWLKTKSTEPTAGNDTIDSGYSTPDDDSYFDNARYTRRQSRDEAVGILKSIVADEKSEAEARLEASQSIAAYATRSEQESLTENQILAKGYEECIVFIGSDNASVVVRTDGLTAAEAAQITDIIVSETKLNAAVVKIIELK